MLRGFLVQHFDELVSRTLAVASERRGPSSSTLDPEREVVELLVRFRELLCDATSTASVTWGGMGAAAVLHARAVLEDGQPVSQVVHEWAALRQAVLELVIAHAAAIDLEELGALSRSLDGAIADAVAEYERLRSEATAHRAIEWLGQVGHDLRNQLQTALLTFGALRKGTVEMSGSAGEALGRSLDRLRDLVDTRLSEVRLAATTRVSLASFLHEVAGAAHAEAEDRAIRLRLEPGDPALAVDVDPQLLATALMELLHNALKYTRPQGCVTLRTRSENGQVFVEVEDECGGMVSSEGDRGHGRRDRRRADRSPGHGLSHSRVAVQANGGELHAHNLPGRGCIFGIQLPVAAPLEAVS